MEKRGSTDKRSSGFGFFNMFQKSPSKSGGGFESSDDEEAPAEQQPAETSGKEIPKNTVLFNNVYCVKTNRVKTFQVDLYNGCVYQFSADGKRKKLRMSDVQQIVKRSDNNHLIVDVKRSRDLTVKQKKFLFDSDKDAEKYQRYIEFCNVAGQSVRAIFDSIDKRATRLITESNLRRALKEVDIDAADGEVEAMLSVNGIAGGVVTYNDFFHLFFDSQICDLRECLEEWLQKGRQWLSSHGEDRGGEEEALTTAEDHVLDELPGEVVSQVIENVRWALNVGKGSRISGVAGVAYLTNYRLAFLSSHRQTRHATFHSRYDRPNFLDIQSVPLASFLRVHSSPQKNTIVINVKDNRVVRVTLSHADGLVPGKLDEITSNLQRMAFASGATDKPQNSLFAYQYRATFNSDGWQYGDVRKEYIRMGLTDPDVWTLLDNSDYSIVETYPQYLVVPAALLFSDLVASIAYRSRGRFPAVTYRHGNNGALLLRSSQPMVGIAQNSSSSDELLLNLYRLRGVLDNPDEELQSTKVYIYDARGQVAATMNMAAGKGTEDVSSYNNAELTFCNIGNIHVMRTSYQQLGELLQPGGYAHLTQGDGSSGYFTRLEECGWLRHTLLILQSAVKVAERIHLEGASVLVHCSDGWDRTSQICSVAEILLDPFYRTMEGIAVLIEKDWCAFGHKFHDRCAHGEDANQLKEERSPVFLQFLDVVFQLLHQFPSAFEFNEQLLVFLGDHLHSCLFGSFLGNSEKQRIQELQAPELTSSIWSYVFDRRNNKRFFNETFAPLEQPLWPATSITRVVIWERFHCRWDLSCHPNRLSGLEWHDDWGLGFETKLVEHSEDGHVSSRPSKRRNSQYRLVGSLKESFQRTPISPSVSPKPAPPSDSSTHLQELEVLRELQEKQHALDVADGLGDEEMEFDEVDIARVVQQATDPSHDDDVPTDDSDGDGDGDEANSCEIEFVEGDPNTAVQDDLPALMESLAQLQASDVPDDADFDIEAEDNQIEAEDSEDVEVEAEDIEVDVGQDIEVELEDSDTEAEVGQDEGLRGERDMSSFTESMGETTLEETEKLDEDPRTEVEEKEDSSSSGEDPVDEETEEHAVPEDFVYY